MSPRSIAVMDVGKTNVKLVVEDVASGRELFVRTRPNRVLAGPPYPHADTEGIWAFVLDALAEAVRSGPVDAVSITTHGAAFALMAGDGLALPVLDYEASGPDGLAADYDAARPPFSESLAPRLPGGLNAGAQLYWQKRAFADDWARVTAILPYPQYWAFRFCGVRASEPTSLGVHTDIWAPARGNYTGLARAEGWDRLLPPPGRAFDRLGPVSPEVARRTGLAADTPVFAGIHDSNASLLPHLLVREPPFTVLSTGTWVIVFAVGGDPAALDAGRDGLANVDAFGRPVPSARFMGGREFDLLTGGAVASPSPDDVRAVIDAGAMILPTFTPGCGPFPAGAGRWTVAAEALSPARRTALVSLYLALVAEAALGVAGAAGPIVIEGPFGRNPLFAEALAALTGRPVTIAEGTTGTSAGAALLALGPDGRPHPAADRRPDGIYDLSGLGGYADAWRREVQLTQPPSTMKDCPVQALA